MDAIITHRFAYGKIRQKAKNFIDRKDVMEVLRRYIRLPEHHQIELLKELEYGISCHKCGAVIIPSFIRKMSRDKYEILKPKGIKAPKDFYYNPLWGGPN